MRQGFLGRSEAQAILLDRTNTANARPAMQQSSSSGQQHQSQHQSGTPTHQGDFHNPSPFGSGGAMHHSPSKQVQGNWKSKQANLENIYLKQCKDLQIFLHFNNFPVQAVLPGKEVAIWAWCLVKVEEDTFKQREDSSKTSKLCQQIRHPHLLLTLINKLYADNLKKNKIMCGAHFHDLILLKSGWGLQDRWAKTEDKQTFLVKNLMLS